MTKGISFHILAEVWDIVYDSLDSSDDRQHLAHQLVGCLVDNGIDIDDIEHYFNSSSELNKAIKLVKDDDVDESSELENNDDYFDDDDDY